METEKVVAGKLDLHAGAGGVEAAERAPVRVKPETEAETREVQLDMQEHFPIEQVEANVVLIVIFARAPTLLPNSIDVKSES